MDKEPIIKLIEIVEEQIQLDAENNIPTEKRELHLDILKRYLNGVTYEKAKEMFVRLMLKDIDEEAENKQFIEDVTRLCDKYKTTI